MQYHRYGDEYEIAKQENRMLDEAIYCVAQQRFTIRRELYNDGYMNFKKRQMLNIESYHDYKRKKME